MSLLDMDSILIELSKERELFYSEADFQFSLALKIKEKYDDAKLFLEGPLNPNSRDRLDILVIYRGVKIPIELKYLVCEIEYNEYHLTNKNDSWVSYNYIKDISRIENFIDNQTEAIEKEGYAIVLANKTLYWNESRSNVINYYNFRLDDGRKIIENEELKWLNQNDTTEKYGGTILLKSAYEFSWKDYSSIPIPKNGNIKYMVCKYIG